MSQTSTPSTTRTLLSLHRVLWKRSFKSNPSQIWGIIVLFIYGLLGCVGLALFTTSLVSMGEFRGLTLLLGSGTFFYWILVIMMPSSENLLNPARLATLPLSAQSYLPGLTWAAILQSRGILVIINSLISLVMGSIALAGSDHVVFIPLWFLSVVAAFAVTMLGGEAISAFATTTGNRSKRERWNSIGLVIFLIVVFGGNLLFNIGSASEEGIYRSATILGFTPIGAAGAITTSALGGSWAAVGIQFLITVISVLLAWRIWRYAVATSLQRVTESGGKAKEVKGAGTLLLPGAKPDSFGAIYSASLRYWFRDSRYRYSLYTLPGMAVFFFLVGTIMGDSPLEYVALFFLAQFIGGMLTNHLGYDGPANWVHMVTGTDPATLIRARTKASIVLGLPLVVICLVALLLLHGFNPLWGVTVGITLGVMGANIGTAALLSIENAYPTAAPGTNPMKDPSGYSSGALVVMVVNFLLIWIPLAPGIILMVKGMNPAGLEGFATNFSDVTILYWLGFALLPIIGYALAYGGIRYYIKHLRKRWPQIFAKVRNYL